MPGRGVRALLLRAHGRMTKSPSRARVAFQIMDGESRGTTTASGPAVPAAVDVSGVRMPVPRVAGGGDNKNFDHADWADVKLTCQSWA